MTPDYTVSHDTIVLWWSVALALTVVVLIVVAVLLERIIRSTKRIHGVVRDIWYGGTRIASNTVTLALLRRTNDLAATLLASAGRIAEASTRIRRAAHGGGR